MTSLRADAILFLYTEAKIRHQASGGSRAKFAREEEKVFHRCPEAIENSPDSVPPRNLKETEWPPRGWRGLVKMVKNILR